MRGTLNLRMLKQQQEKPIIPPDYLQIEILVGWRCCSLLGLKSEAITPLQPRVACSRGHPAKNKVCECKPPELSDIENKGNR